MKLFLTKILLVIIISTWASTATAESAPETLESYVFSGDIQNVDELDSVLHPEFVSNYVFKGKDNVKSLDRASFISMFEKKKFGGEKREFLLRSMNESKNLTLIDAQLKNSKLIFTGVFVMQRINAEWKLKEEFLIVEPAT